MVYYIVDKKQTPQELYHAKYRRDYRLPCFTNTESDIIDKLDSVGKGKVSRYIKDLIRKDIKRE
jgi:hypothetical protein